MMLYSETTYIYNYYYHHHNITIIKILNQLLLFGFVVKLNEIKFVYIHKEVVNRKSGTIKKMEKKFQPFFLCEIEKENGFVERVMNRISI